MRVLPVSVKWYLVKRRFFPRKNILCLKNEEKKKEGEKQKYMILLFIVTLILQRKIIKLL